MTNNNAIGFAQIAESAVSDNFRSESKVDLTDALYYALKKNLRVIKAVSSEYGEIQKDILEVFKNQNKVDDKKLEDEAYSKEVNEAYQQYLKVPENVTALTEFLDSEFKGELHYVTIEDIDKSKLPIRESGIFEEFLVKKESDGGK